MNQNHTRKIERLSCKFLLQNETKNSSGGGGGGGKNCQNLSENILYAVKSGVIIVLNRHMAIAQQTHHHLKAECTHTYTHTFNNCILYSLGNFSS